MGFLLQSLGLEASSDESPVYRTIDHDLAEAQARRNGKGLTLQTAVGLPGVYRAIQLIYGMGSSLPINSWRGTTIAPRQPQVIRQPDPWRPRRSWTLRNLTNLAGDGNTFLRKSLDPIADDGTVIAAEALNPFAVTIRWKDGRKTYEHRTAKGTEVLSSEQIEHVWLNEFPGMERGLGPIEACRLSLTGGMDIRDYAAGWFDRGAIPPGVLSTDQAIDKTTATAMKDWWHEDSRRIKVVGKGLKFDPILIKPEDAQWIEAQKFTVLDIARMFGIPPILLLAAIEGSSLTYQNLQMVNEQLLDTTLKPLYLEPLEAAMTTMTPLGQEARFDASKFTRRDDKTRMETHEIAIRAGIYDADHARVEESIPGPAPRKETAAA